MENVSRNLSLSISPTLSRIFDLRPGFLGLLQAGEVSDLYSGRSSPNDHGLGSLKEGFLRIQKLAQREGRNTSSFGLRGSGNLAQSFPWATQNGSPGIARGVAIIVGNMEDEVKNDPIRDKAEWNSILVGPHQVFRFS